MAYDDHGGTVDGEDPADDLSVDADGVSRGETDLLLSRERAAPEEGQRGEEQGRRHQRTGPWRGE